MFIETVLCAFALSGINLNVQDVPIKYRSASEVMQKIHPFPHPQTMILAVDRANLVRLIGPKEECQKVKQVIDLFDIKPMRFKLIIEVQNRIRKTSVELEAKVTNASVFKFTDQETGAEIAISPTFQNRNSIEIILSYKFDRDTITSSFRSKPNVQSTFNIGDHLQSSNGNELQETAVTIKIKPVLLP